MTATIIKVEQFHKAFGHPISDVPTPATDRLRKLRLDLILEEFKELVVAMGYEFTVHGSNIDPDGLQVIKVSESVDLVEVADALGDIDYVVAGAALVFGLPHGEVIHEIHRANMSKLGADGKPIYREDGKVLKGPHYRAPNIQGIFDELARG